MKQNIQVTRLDLAGVLRSLKTQDTPWKQKIRLAHKLLQKDCKFPNKLQLILDWAGQEIVFNATHKCYPTEMLQELWQIIVEILTTVEDGIEKNHLSLRMPFVEIVMKEFQVPGGRLSSFIECCKMIFSSEELYKPVVAKFEKFVNFLANVLRYSQLMHDTVTTSELIGEKDVIAAYFDLVDVLLKLFVKLAKNHANTQKVAVTFNEKLLKEIAVWKYSFSKFVNRTGVNWKSLSTKDILEKTLWSSSNMAAVKSHVHLWGVNEAAIDKTTQKFALLDSLFSGVDRCVASTGEESRLVVEAMLVFIPDLYEALLVANKFAGSLPRHFEFTMFKRLCSLVFPRFERLEKCSEMDLQSSICLCHLLEILLEFNVFKVNDELVNTDSNNTFLQNLTKIITRKIKTSSPQFTERLLKCIQYLMEIDRSLFESLMQEILQELLVPVASKDCEGDGELLDKAKCSLFCFIVDMYSNGRQMEEFFKELVAAIRSSESQIDVYSSVFERLKDATSSVSMAQSLSMSDALLCEMTDNYIEKIKDFVTSNDFGTPVGEGIKGTVRKLSVLAETLSICMLNARILPMNGYIGDNQKSYVSMVKTLQQNCTVITSLFVKINEKEHTKSQVLLLAWKHVLTLQKISLYLLHHGVTEDPLPSKTDYVDILNLLTRGSEKLTSRYFGSEVPLIVKSLILQTRQMILISEEDAVVYCCSQLNSFIVGCLGAVDGSDETEVKLSVTASVVKELSWLVEYLGHNSICVLCQVLFDVMTKQSELSDRSQQMVMGTVQEKLDDFTQLVSLPVFYDNTSLQTAFCDVMVRKMWTPLTRNFPSDLKEAVTKFLGSMHNIENVPSEQPDIGTTPMDIAQDTSELHHKDALVDSMMMQGCSDIMVALLGACARDEPMRNVMADPEAVGWRMECHQVLRVIRIMSFEWMTPWNAARVLVSVALILYRVFSSPQRLDGVGWFHEEICHVLDQFTASTMITNRLSVWKFIDPNMLLQCYLNIFEKLTHQHSFEPPDTAFTCIKNLWYLVLNVKRCHAGEAVFEDLKLKMRKIAEELSRNPDVFSVEVLHGLVSVVLDTIQSRIVKKRPLVIGLELIYPVTTQILSDRLTYSRVLAVKDSATEGKVAFAVLRCYCHVYSICLQMKVAGKDERFLSLIRTSELKETITDTGYSVRDALVKLAEGLEIGPFGTLKEKICLEFLQSVSKFEDCEEVDQLQTLDFFGPVFKCLCSIIQKTGGGGKDLQMRPICFQIMANYINNGKENVAENLLNELIFKIRSTLHDRQSLLVLIEFCNFLLGHKSSKENKVKFTEFLPKMMYVCIEMIGNTQKTHEEALVVAAFECIGLVVGFAKGALVPSLAVSSIHSLVIASEATFQYRNPKLLQLKVMLLSKLLFNYTNAAFGAIASFAIGVKNLLLEFALLVQPNSDPPIIDQPTPTPDILRASESIARLYQELGGHKKMVAKMLLVRAKNDVISPRIQLFIVQKHVPYLIADYLQVVTSQALPEEYQRVFTEGIYCLMDSCNSTDSAYLNMALSHGDRELFKDLYKTFVKHHKYTGKA